MSQSKIKKIVRYVFYLSFFVIPFIAGIIYCFIKEPLASTILYGVIGLYIYSFSE